MHKFTLRERIKLASHNPTVGVLFKTVRLEVQFAFVFALASIISLNWYPHEDNFDFKTLMWISVEIWERICYSILASTVFYFINQHIPKIEKKVTVYNFEVNNIRKIIFQIKDLLERTTDQKIAPNRGTSPEDLYSSLSRGITLAPPKRSEEERQFKDWSEFIKFRIDNISELINKLLPLHDVLERSTPNICSK